MQTKLGIIGAGAMGSAIIRGVIQAKVYSADSILVSDVNQARLQEMQDKLGLQTYPSAGELASKLNAQDILLIAVKPQNFGELLESCQTLNPGVTIVSIAAGIAIKTIAKYFTDNPIIRTMPNTPAQVLAGATALAANNKCTEQNINAVQQIFSSIGESVLVDESDLDTVTALSGSGPAYIFLMIEAMTEAAIKLGLSKDKAEILAKQTVYGAAKLAKTSDSNPRELREQVTSPGGTTQAALTSFEANQFRNVVFDALKAAQERSTKLGLTSED